MVESVSEFNNQRDRPKCLQIQASRVLLTNVRSSDPSHPSSKASLVNTLEAAQMGQLFFASDFPSAKNDFQPISSKFVKHAMSKYYLM